MMQIQINLVKRFHLIAVTVASALINPGMQAQNVGIGTTTPTGPLAFANNTGNKIVFLGNGAQGHMGIGVSPVDLQLYTQNEFTGISFGYGSSTNFTERMRITNTGIDAMSLRGRMHLLNATPANPASGSGIWLYKPDNSAALSFMGTQNSQNVGFYGGPVGWGFIYDAINSRVGIGNNAPSVRLDIGGTDGWDLVNGEGDMRIGNPNYRIKFGIALGGGGVGAAAIMQAGGIGALSLGAGGKYLLHLNGSNGFVDFQNNSAGIRINGNAGTNGQVLTSNGNAAPQWKSMSELLPDLTNYIAAGQEINLSTNSTYDGTPINFVMPANSTLLLWVQTRIFSTCSIGPCHTAFLAQLLLDGNHIGYYSVKGVAFPGSNLDEKSLGPMLINASPGNHTLSFKLTREVGSPSAGFYPRLVFLPN